MSARVLVLLLLVMHLPKVMGQHAPPVARVEPLAAMHWARVDHATTVLSDGRVLITGGSCFGREAPIPWAEIFDPASMSFNDTGSLIVPRFDHVAVLLDDGDVLVAGGWRAGYVEATATAEVWDRKTGKFALVGSMTVPRGSSAAVARLADGSLLFIGGTREGGYGTATDAIDIFDPTTRTFARWGALTMARSEAIVQDIGEGRLLVSGGGFRCCSHPADARRTSSQEVLDLQTRQSRPAESLPEAVAVRAEYTVWLPRGPTVVAPVGGPALAFDGTWHRLPKAEEDLLCSHTGLLALTADRVLSSARDLVVLDLSRLQVIPMAGAPPSPGATRTLLPDGRVLATGGDQADLRAIRSAWIVTVP